MTKQIDIKGLHCSSCAKKLEDTLSTIFGGVHVHVDLASEQVRVEGPVETDLIIAAIQQQGYDVDGQSEPQG